MAISDDKQAERSPNPIDVHVGQRIRQRRKTLGVSQERLADELGLTFQQVQKYERGANRVSASKLWEIGRVLDVSISAFFEGLAAPAQALAAAGVREPDTAFVHDGPPQPRAETTEILELMNRMDDKRRRLVLDVARAMAAQGEADPVGSDH